MRVVRTGIWGMSALISALARTWARSVSVKSRVPPSDLD